MLQRSGMVPLIQMLCLGGMLFQGIWLKAADADQQDTLQAGSILYADYCKKCHGKMGKGGFGKTPLNFFEGDFILENLNPGELPSDKEILEIIVQGITETRMLGFSVLTDDEKQALLIYVKDFLQKRTVN